MKYFCNLNQLLEQFWSQKDTSTNKFVSVSKSDTHLCIYISWFFSYTRIEIKAPNFPNGISKLDSDIWYFKQLS